MKTIIVLLIAALCINATMVEQDKYQFANQPTNTQPPVQYEVDPYNPSTPSIAQDLPYFPGEKELNNHNQDNKERNESHEGRHERNHEGKDHKSHEERKHHNGENGHHEKRGDQEGHMRKHGDKHGNNGYSNFNNAGPQNHYKHKGGKGHKKHLPKGVRIALIVGGSIVALLTLCCIVKCCKRRKQLKRERKLRRDAMRQQQLQTQQFLNNSNNMGQGFLQYQTQPSIALGQPVNVAPQMMNYQYPPLANTPTQQQQRPNQQQPYYGVPNQPIAQGQAIYVPQQYRQPHPVVANSQGYMQVELPQLQVNNHDTSRSGSIDTENSRRYPVLNQQQNAPYNAQGYQQF